MEYKAIVTMIIESEFDSVDEAMEELQNNLDNISKRSIIEIIQEKENNNDKR